MATIPPWLNVSPSDFLQAMQSGAMAGLQVSSLRQRARADADRLALAAAENEAARERAAAALDFQRWEQGERSRLAAAELAQQGQIARAQLQERGMEAALENQAELAKQAATQQHQQRLEETAKGRLELEKSRVEANLERIRNQLGLPQRYHLTTVQGKVIATDPFTGESFVAYPPDAATPQRLGPVPPPGSFSFLPEKPTPQLFDFSAPIPGLDRAAPAAPAAGVSRYIFRDGELTPAE